MIRHINLAFWMLVALIGLGYAHVLEAADDFENMAQPTEAFDECVAPRPPRDLAKTAYIRNGYRTILRIIAARQWQETGECTCAFATISWEDVVEKSVEFAVRDDPLRPFDTSELRLLADTLEAERSAVCKAE